MRYPDGASFTVSSFERMRQWVDMQPGAYISWQVGKEALAFRVTWAWMCGLLFPGTSNTGQLR